MSRELLFRVTRKDFTETHIRGSGAGGQHRNKVSSGVRLVHNASGAVGESTQHKSQSQNRIEAFRKIREHPLFKAWFNEMVTVSYGRPSVQSKIDAAMSEEYITTQTLDDKGRWVTVDIERLT